MNDVTHYACMGTCKGTSPDVKTCDTPDCTHLGADLIPCGCTDGMHGAAHGEM